MAFKTIFVLCASALLVNTISGQCINQCINQCNTGVVGLGLVGNGLTGCGSGLNLAGCNAGCSLGNGYAANLGNLASLSGGELLVSSYSPIAPSGLSVTSENVLEGILAAYGELPFLSAVALEGQVASGGAAGVSYSCGNGEVGIIEQIGGAGLGVNNLGYGAGLNNIGLVGAGLGYGAGSCGCGVGLGNIGLTGGYGAGSCGCGVGLGNIGLTGGYGAGNCGCGVY